MGWHAVADADAIGVDEALGINVDGVPIALCRTAAGYHAVYGVCTHEFALLSDGYVEDGCIECPLHQGRFELASGKPVAPPVIDPIKVYAVKVEGGKILVEIDG